MKGMALVAAVIAMLAMALLAPPVDADDGDRADRFVYGEAKILVGTSTRLSIARTSQRGPYTVALRRGSCSTPGALVVSGA
jgi:hypothetical protein